MDAPFWYYVFRLRQSSLDNEFLFRNVWFGSNNRREKVLTHNLLISKKGNFMKITKQIVRLFLTFSQCFVFPALIGRVPFPFIINVYF